MNQQHRMHMAGWKSLDQSGEKLQFQRLHGLCIGDDEAAANRVFLRFVLRLLQCQLRQDGVESVDQLLGVDRPPQVYLGIGLLTQSLVDRAAVVRQRHLIIADDGKVRRFLAEHFQ